MKNNREYTEAIRTSAMITKQFLICDADANRAIEEIVEAVTDKTLDGPMPSCYFHNTVKGDVKALSKYTTRKRTS